MNTHKSFPNSTKMQQALNALRTNPGSTTPALRHSIETYASGLTHGEQNAEGVPDDLRSYIDKVVLHAYKITDGDVQQLIDAGYSEDSIYEITLCASVATSLARVMCGFQATE